MIFQLIQIVSKTQRSHAYKNLVIKFYIFIKKTNVLKIIKEKYDRRNYDKSGLSKSAKKLFAEKENADCF
ncbi:hypothetical protein NUACC21_59570 [Scytonema sp. NUACC21]